MPATRLLLLLLPLLLTHWPEAQGQQTCDANCQAAQQQALSALYHATGGEAWVSTTALVVTPTGWLNTSSTGTGLPAHCLWSGKGLSKKPRRRTNSSQSICVPASPSGL